ncbi:MAG: hypothetical protein NC250_08425 [Alistipes senegalensis]|nr:hypothetical protein [Bacteroides cellulosilyticus]MCM1352742.1 hypothetical protein [Alistipes senegalensis]
MSESLFLQFCKYVDESIFPKENGGESIAFIVDQAFIDDFCKKFSTSEDVLLKNVRLGLNGTSHLDHLHVKGILAIQLYAATKREDSGGITERNYRNRLSQVLDWDIQDLRRWMEENQERYWGHLYSWCSQNDFLIARCSPKTGTGRYVQYPIQQAERVFTQKDLNAIAYHFVEYNLRPGEDISELDFWKILSKGQLPYYIHTNHGRRLVEKPEYLQDAYKQIYNFYLRWDGNYLDIERNKSAKVPKEQHFLYLSEDGHIDIRDKNMKLEKQIGWDALSTALLNPFYSFKRSQWILFRKNEDYEEYWEETRYLEWREEDGKTFYEDGMVVFFTSSDSFYRYSEANPFSNLLPIYSSSRIKIYRLQFSSNLAYLYTEKKFFGLEGGLKVGRLQYILGGAPILSISKDSSFWIDGEKPSISPIAGQLNLNFLSVGSHDIKFPGFKKIEFTIVDPEPVTPSWDESYNKWIFSCKDKQWLTARSEKGIVGLDYSIFKIKNRGETEKSVLRRWARFHLTGKSSNEGRNIALKLLNKH